MAEARICGTCGQAASGVGGYRTAAEREQAPEEKPARPPTTKPMVLAEEFEEAVADMFPWAVAAGVFAFFFVGLLAAAVHPAARPTIWSWTVPTVATGGATLFCLVGLLRCRATIRAWRDQKRAALAGKEAANG